MKNFKRKTSATVIAAALLSSGAVLANDYVDNARVRNVTPEYQRVNNPRSECHNYDGYRDGYYNYHRSTERGVSGSIIGGVTGALIGSQIGHGNGNRAATAVGAIAGAVVGDRIQNNNRDVYREGAYVDARDTRCRTVDFWETRTTGYRVVYEYAGREYTTVLPYDPGRYLRVRVSVEPVANQQYSSRDTQW